MALLKCYDPWLFFVVFLLVLAGVLMVGSSTSYLALKDWKDPSLLYFRQGLHAVAGLVKAHEREVLEVGLLPLSPRSCRKEQYRDHQSHVSHGSHQTAAAK